MTDASVQRCTSDVHSNSALALARTFGDLRKLKTRWG
jgi:hypothetical protein